MRTALKFLLAAALVMPTGTMAGNDKAKKGNGAAAQEIQTTVAITAHITVTERRIILGFLDDHQASLPGSLANAKPLPPGIARKVARGGELPPGIAKRYLPNDLLVQLPPRPGYEWVVVGTDVLLIAVATGLIVDLLDDVL